MKIAYDAKRFFQNSSGLGNYSRDLVRMLSQYYPENQYLLLNKKKTEKGQNILEREEVKFIKTSKGKFARQLKMGIDAQNADADIFHGLSGEIPLKWNHKTIKKIVTIHDLIFMRYPEFYSFFDRKIHFWKFKKAAHSADLVIAISEQTKQDVMHYLGVSEDKIKVVYQGCHNAFKEFISEERKKKITEKYHLPKHFILNVGTIEDRKNLLNVVKALRNENIPIVAVGRKTNYYKKIISEIKSYNQEVIFLENIPMEELAVFYRLADIFIYPSLFEGFGIPVIEALYSETPVITSNVSCLPEAGGAYSMYVNPESIEDIKAKILFLWNNEAERKRRAEKGLEYVQKFNDEKIARQIMAIYRKILSL